MVYSAVLGAVAYFELIAIATKHLPATVVGISVAFEPLAVTPEPHPNPLPKSVEPPKTPVWNPTRATLT